MILASRIPRLTEQIHRATLRAQENAPTSPIETIPEAAMVAHLRRRGFLVLPPAHETPAREAA
jgi:hypothetical protein